MSTRRRAWACLTAAVAALIAPLAFAQGVGLADYRLDNEGWNGLSSLVAVGQFLGVEVVAEQPADLGSLAPGDVLAVVYPTSELDAERVAAWVERGGRLLVADDFGTSEGLGRAFRLDRVAPDPTHATTFADNAALPMLRAVGEHRLSEGVRSVVANHPAALRGDGLPVFAFDDGAGLVYDISLGQGTAVFVADPSMFMNLMLPIADNAVLARNIIAYLCDGRATCRIVVASSVTGSAPAPAVAGPGRVPDSVRSLNENLDRLRSITIDGRALYLASLLLLLGLTIVMATVFPTSLPAWVRPPAPAPKHRAASQFELSVRRFVGPRSEASQMMPASLVREAFDAVFWPALKVKCPSPDASGDKARHRAAELWVARYASALQGRERARRVRAVSALLEAVNRVPSRGQVMVSMRGPMSQDELVALHDGVLKLLEAMEKDGDYRGRAERPG